MTSSEPVIVVGGGVLGLLAAVACARAGTAVTVLERGPIPNPDASSSDEHRIVRALHLGDPAATARAVAAQAAWQELEALLGEQLHYPVGVLTVLRPEQAEPARAALAAAGGRGELLVAAELAARWPHLRFPGSAAGLLEPAAGVVLADRALAAMTGWLRGQALVTLRPGHEVVALDPAAGTLRLADGALLRGRVLVTAGPWSRALLPAAIAAELSLLRQTMLYCAVPPEQRAAWARTPVVLGLDPAHGAWVVPPVAGTHLKLSAHSACRDVPEVTDHAGGAEWRAHLVGLFGAQLAGFRPEWVVAARDCYYLADRAGGGARELALAQGPARVWAHAACGGGGFKFAPLVARSLVERTLAAVPAAYAAVADGAEERDV